MIGYFRAMRAEYRKLLSVRSTYYIYLVMLLLEILFGFWIFGFKAGAGEIARAGYLQSVATNGIYFLAVFPAIVAILLMSHEYRYNTILYALTSSPSRLRVLFAKIKVITVYALVTTAAFAAVAIGLSLLGNHLAGHTLAPQSLPYAKMAAQLLFYGWGVAMFGLMLAALLRSQVVAIVAILVIPYLIEPILSLLLKANSIYLPFSALAQVIGNPNGNPVLTGGDLSGLQSAGVFLIYLVVGWLIAAVLFVRRSAN